MIERTLAIIKPDAVADKHTGYIINIILANGFKILGLKQICLSKEQAGKFYDVHFGKPFYDGLVEFMTSGAVVTLALERENAVAEWRKTMGATDPKDAEEGTVRKLYARSKGENASHGSDSIENGIKEVAFFFSETELTIG